MPFYDKWKISRIKGSIFLKNRHFIIQERINKLINLYGIDQIMNCGIWHTVKFQLVSRQKWNDFLLYLWINIANINSGMW